MPQLLSRQRVAAFLPKNVRQICAITTNLVMWTKPVGDIIYKILIEG
jgi:hypothetical protein